MTRLSKLTYKQITKWVWVWITVICISAIWLFYRPSNVALFIMGLTSADLAALILIKRKTILDEYVKAYKKRKKISKLTAPTKIAYNLNIYFLWPLVLLMGVLAVIVSVV